MAGTSSLLLTERPSTGGWGVISNCDNWMEEPDLIRVRADMYGETWIYTYPIDEGEAMMRVIASHVVDGKLHPIAGHILTSMVAEGDDASDMA